MSNRIVLFSQPSSVVFEKLKIALFPKYLKNRIFAYMPSEGENVELNAKYTPLWQEFAESNGAKFVYIDNSNRGEKANIEKQKVLTSDILMITGGNTFKLLNNLRKSGLDSTVIDFWKKGECVLSGFSAGAIVLSPSIETAKTGCGDINDLGLTDLAGLEIIDFEVWPHYEFDQGAEVAKYKSKNKRELKTIGNDEVLVIDK